MLIRIDELIRVKRRTISLQIKTDGRLVVRAPLRVSENYINKLIIEKSAWIINKKNEARLKQKILEDKKHETGQCLIFLGQKLEIPQNLKENKTAKITWYKKEALKYLSARVDYYTQKFSLKYKSVRINNARKRWGSCTSKGSINFSWRLIMAPKEVVDYIVVHEVAHLAHCNHSARFWNLVEKMMPNYRVHEAWLKKHGFLLDL